MEMGLSISRSIVARQLASSAIFFFDLPVDGTLQPGPKFLARRSPSQAEKMIVKSVGKFPMHSSREFLTPLQGINRAIVEASDRIRKASYGTGFACEAHCSSDAAPEARPTKALPRGGWVV